MRGPQSGTAVRAQAPGAQLARHERNAEATKRRLLMAAEIEFAAKGFDGARLANIARAAGVQQALIHHYFGDKEGLYREVLSVGLAAVTRGGWDILARLSEASEGSSIAALTEAFVEMLLSFYASHRTLLAIIRHEAAEELGGGPTFDDLVASTLRPMFEAVVERLEGMRARKEVRREVDVRHLCVSVIAMACFPFQEERMLRAMWPVDWSSPDFLAERKRAIVALVLSHAAPSR